MDARRDRLDRRVHPAMVGARLVVEDDRDDQHHDIGGPGRLGAVERGPQPARSVRVADEVGEPRLLADVRLPGVDRVDDPRVDVDRDDRPPVRGELRRERQAHLAGADDRDGPGRAGLADPRRDEAHVAVTTGVGRQRDRAAGEAVGRARAGARAHADTSSTARRSRADVRRACARTTAQRPSSASTIGRSPVRTTWMKAASSASSGSSFETGSSATSPAKVGA